MKLTSSVFTHFSISLPFLCAISIAQAQSPEPAPRQHPATASRRASHHARLHVTSPSFAAAQTSPAGFGGATQSVAGDFSGDGVTDIAVVNPCNSSYCGAGSASVAVLLGNGDGSFQAPVVYPLGTFEPMSVAAGDFNGDGKLDLVLASQCASSTTCGTGSISVLLGNGDGTFQTPVSYAAGTGSSYFVAVGDFNQDGQLDLVVANQTSGTSTVNILLGNGDGTFQAPLSYSTGAATAEFVAVGDFNNDGAPDLAVANGGAHSVSILLGNGNGTLQAPTLYASGGAFTYAIAIGDFNEDGAPDLAVANGCASYNNLQCSTSGSVGVLLGNGDGTFQPPVSYGSAGNQAISIFSADFNGDGNLDLAVADRSATAGGSAGTVSVLAGNGDGTFQPAVTSGAGGSYASSVVSSDFNGDGRPDLAVVNQCPTSGNCTSAVAGILLNSGANFQLYATSTSLAATVNPAGANQAVLLAATVSPGFNAGAASGSVTFYDGDNTLSTVAVSGGQASYTASFAAPGGHNLQAVYSGASNYASSTSPVVSEIVGAPVALISSANPSALNQAVTFTATVAGSGVTPAGSVTFMNGSTSLGTFPLVNGSATAGSSSLPVGTQTITASYSGDANFAPGFATLTQAVDQGTTTALASSANPASVNQPITFTATVTGQYGGVPGGAVAFLQGSPAIVWGTAPLVNGQATISSQFAGQNSYPITAVYLGSATYQASTSSVVSQVVSGSQGVTTTTALMSSGTPSYINQPVTFTATVVPNSGVIPNGETVTFYNGTNAIGTGSTANGAALFTTSTLGVGTDTITATYAGDANYQTSTSHAVYQVVKLTPTTLSVSSSLSPSVYGQAVVFSVTVAPQAGSGTPTGSVTLKNGGTAFGSVQLTNGSGTFSTSSLPVGSLSLTASYSGDSNFTSSSAALTQVVNAATTVTTLSSSPNPSSLNQNVTFTASVAGQYAGSVGGTVTFTQGSNTLGTSTTTFGKATLSTSFAKVGTFPVVATYSGDANNLASSSSAVNQVVGTISTTTVLATSGTPAFIGQTVTFTATITPASGAIPAAETVTFYDGAVALGTGTTANNIATLSTSTLATGTHSITAAYAGDANYQTSTSRALTQVVSLYGTSTAVVSSVNPSTFGQSVTFTASVTATSGSLSPTGKVYFKNNGTVVAAVAMVNGTAAYTTATLPAGSLAMSAAYSGDANFAVSSTPLTQVVNQATSNTGLISSVNPSSATQSVTFTATVTSQYVGAVTGSVTFMNGSKALGSSTITSGKATFTYAFQTTGTNAISAVYGGDSNNQGSTSNVVSQTVTNEVTTTTVSSSAASAVFGQPLTLSATVTSTYGAIPDGELVTFYDAGASIGTGTTTGGVASMNTSSLTVGTHTITATYAGDSTFQTSTSKTYKQVITQQSTNTLLTSSANASAYGQAVTFTATVTAAGPTPTGTVTWKNGSTILGVSPVNAQGVTSYTTLTLAAGSYPITASYSGSASSAKSTSAVLTQVVNPAATTTQIYSSINPASVGGSITFTAVVQSGTTVPSGTVTFSLGSQVLGTATLAGGSARLSGITTLPAGANNITATYAGAAGVAGSAASMTQYVQ